MVYLQFYKEINVQKQINKLAKKYKNRPRKRPLDQTERKRQASMEASIDDTNPKYYILYYKNGNIEAKGYILK